MFGDLFRAAGNIVGAVTSIAVTPLAIALGVSESIIRAAIRAGCRTEREIREWIEDNQ